MDTTTNVLEFMKKSASFYNKDVGNLYEQDDMFCDKCNNRGGFLEIRMIDLGDRKEPYEFYVECECQMTRANLRSNQKRTEASGLKDLLTKSFDNFNANTTELKEIKAKAFENVDVKNWFFIGGQSGAGKSHISAAIAKTLLNKRFQVKYSIWLNDFRELNFLQNERGQYNARIHQLKNVQVLLIDDFFKTKRGEEISNADVQVAYEVLNHRYNENKKTIISSELTINEIMKLDEALAGRIVEKGKPYIFNISRDVKKNYRLK